MIKQECIGIPDMIFINFFVSKKIKIKAGIVLSPGGAYFLEYLTPNCQKLMMIFDDFKCIL